MGYIDSSSARKLGIIALQQANADRQKIIRFIRITAKQPLRDELDAKNAASSSLQKPNSLVLNNAFDRAKEIMENSEKLSITVISSADDAYPPYLRLANDHPFILYVKGNLDILASYNTIGIIGARDASRQGIQISWKIAEWFAGKDFTIISGLSIGIDAAAHRGAVYSKGKTIALLAHGLDMVFPAENALLANRILGRGALVSEHPIGVEPNCQRFGLRDRIYAGMTPATVVVECLANSGTIYTANEVIEKGRLLYTISPEVAPSGWKSEGSSSLLSRKLALPIDISNIEESLSKIAAAIEMKKPSFFPQ